MSFRERLDNKGVELQRRGADPRRADPKYTKPVTLTTKQAVRYAAVLLSCGMVIAVLGLMAIGFWADLRPAHPGDIRLATIVRSVVPHADSASEAELEVRLAMPPALGQALAPLVTSDPHWTALDLNWLKAFIDEPPIVVTEDRIAALGRLVSTLAEIKEGNQRDTIRDLVNLYVATLSPTTRELVQRIATLPHDVQRKLVESRDFLQLLDGIADLSEPQRKALADSRLQLMPTDPERLQLIVEIPKLDVPVVRLINVLGRLNPESRQVLLYTVHEISSGSQQFRSVLSLYARQDPRLLWLAANSGTGAHGASPRRGQP